MQVTFYQNFSKRINSTKRPSGSGVSYDVGLKNGTSIEKPTFMIDGIDLSFNYCFWEGSYYFIDDIVLNNNSIYEISCSMDPLATFRDYIQNYSAFVERCASAFEVMIPDGMLSTQNDIIKKASANTSLGLNAAGIYQMLVSSKNGIVPYAFADPVSASAFYNAAGFKSKNDTLIGTIDNLLTSAGLQAVNLQEYMGPMMWLPIDPGVLEDASVSVGYWTLTEVTASVNSAIQYPAIETAINFPENSYDDWRKADNRFSRYTLFLPGIGAVSLNAIDVAESDLWASMRLDCYTGAVTYRIYHGTSGADVAYYNGMLGVQIPCGGANYNVTNTVFNTLGSVLGTAVNMADGNEVGAVSTALNGIVGAAKSAVEPQGNISGGNGNIANIRETTWIVASLENYGSMEYPTNVAGRPYYRNNVLYNFSGYVKCGNASVDIPGFPSEKNAVNNYLNSGFYME